MTNSKKRGRAIRPTERDIGVLRLAEPLGFTTTEEIRRRYFSEKSHDAMNSTLRRLLEAGLFVTGPLIDNRRTYQLTPEGCRIAGCNRDRSRPTKPPGLPEKYSVHWFTAIQPDQPRILFNPGLDGFDVDPTSVRRSYFAYEEVDNFVMVVHMVLDLGTSARRVVQKGATRLGKYLDRQWLDSLLLGDAFKLAILTSSAEKADRIASTVQENLLELLHRPLKRLFPQSLEEVPFPIHIYVVPDLDRLLLIHNPNRSKSQ